MKRKRIHVLVSHRRQIIWRGKQRVAGCEMQPLRLAGQAVRFSGAALRQPKIDRLQGGGLAAPAVSSFLERERLSDLHPVCDRKTVPACRRWIWLARFRIPACARATRCQRTAYRKRRQHYHFNRGGHQGALLGYLVIDLKYLTDRQEILAIVRRMNLRDA